MRGKIKLKEGNKGKKEYVDGGTSRSTPQRY